MKDLEFFDQHQCGISIIACVFLTISYVASLYVWRTNLSRDHPSTIKRRFFSVLCMMILAPFFVQFFFTRETISRGDLLHHLGLRWSGLAAAIFVPLLLTAILFLGPLTMQGLSGLWKLYSVKQGPGLAAPMYWLSSWRDLVWVRNHIMAPLSEEWVFRACMIPLLLQCIEPMTTVFVGPLLFGIAHFHHMFEQIKAGNEFKVAFLVSSFQFTYTSMFGAYSSYLFLRTGHFVSPLVAHMFCNHMGFPNFMEIGQFPALQRVFIVLTFFLGLGLWCYLLTPLTSPEIYDNRLNWET